MATVDCVVSAGEAAVSKWNGEAQVRASGQIGEKHRTRPPRCTRGTPPTCTAPAPTPRSSGAASAACAATPARARPATTGRGPLASQRAQAVAEGGPHCCCPHPGCSGCPPGPSSCLWNCRCRCSRACQRPGWLVWGGDEGLGLAAGSGACCPAPSAPTSWVWGFLAIQDDAGAGSACCWVSR